MELLDTRSTSTPSLSGWLRIGTTNQSTKTYYLRVNDEHVAAYDDFRLCVNESLIGREIISTNYHENREGLEALRKSVRIAFDR